VLTSFFDVETSMEPRYPLPYDSYGEAMAGFEPHCRQEGPPSV
jgi:hypothetical protein